MDGKSELVGMRATFGQQILPTKEDLDKASTDVPICLIAGDAHTIWLNSKALEVLKLTPEAIPQNIGGEAVVENGELTGYSLKPKPSIIYQRYCLYIKTMKNKR